MKKLDKLLSKLAFVFILYSALSGFSQDLKSSLNISEMIQPLTKEGVFKDSLYYNWSGSMIKTDEGNYHLFYSRWKKVYGFSGWMTFSEIAHAVSEKPTGPWQYKETVLKGRGSGYWDEITANNPKIKYFEGKYYLYYITTNFGGKLYTNTDLLEASRKPLKDPNKRTLRDNQRIGVAVSNSINGPWVRMDKALIEPSGVIETLAISPAISKGKDGNYYLIVKGDKPNVKRKSNQVIAVAKSPIGPFKIQKKLIVDGLEAKDIAMWYDIEQSVFYGIFYTHSIIGLMTSTNGLNWDKTKHHIIMNKDDVFKNNVFLNPGKIEHPSVLVEDNVPTTLSLAIKTKNDAYTIYIPLKKQSVSD